MVIDVATSIAASGVIAAFFGIALLLYRSAQKTYPGFGCWTLSFFVAAAGYFAVLARLFIPEAISAILGNSFFVVAAVLRLDGAKLFMGQGRMHRMYYLAPLLVTGSSAFFAYVVDSIVWRNLAFSAVLGAISLYVGFVFLSNAPAGRALLYRLIGYSVFLFTGMLWLRALVWIGNPEATVLDDSSFQVVYFSASIVFDLIWGFCLPMLNSLRLDYELKESQQELQTTVGNLQAALAEISTLSGLLPICSSCKKIRDDQGYWNQLEVYFADHAGFEFTHSICPDCLHRLYPEVYGNIRAD